MIRWRADDEALLARLEDELLFERFWDAVGEGPRPHRRAAGLLAGLRALPDGWAAFERASHGDFAPLSRLANHPDPSTLTPALAHHLALFHARIADALERSPDPSRRGNAEWPRMRSVAMWLWLGEESAYLAATAASVVAGGLPKEDVARAAGEAPYEAIARLGERAKAGARELSDPARIALRVLARVSEAAALARVSERVTKQAERRAARARSAAIDDAIGRIDHALEEASARAASTDELVSLLADASAVWHWAHRDEQVERFLVERITPFCWERYRERRWPELRAMLRPLEPPVDHLSSRVERDASHVAYAAPCAQMFVFRAEVAQSFDQQLALAERAVALCPTHRNGRLVLADLLVERGLRALDVAMPWATGDALGRAAADVRRAEELFPLNKRLAEAKQRLRALGRDLDAA